MANEVASIDMAIQSEIASLYDKMDELRTNLKPATNVVEAEIQMKIIKSMAEVFEKLQPLLRQSHGINDKKDAPLQANINYVIMVPEMPKSTEEWVSRHTPKVIDINPGTVDQGGFGSIENLDNA